MRHKCSAAIGFHREGYEVIPATVESCTVTKAAISLVEAELARISNKLKDSDVQQR